MAMHCNVDKLTYQNTLLRFVLDKDCRLENPPKVCVCNHIWLSRNWIIGVLRDNIKTESADIWVLEKYTLLG